MRPPSARTLQRFRASFIIGASVDSGVEVQKDGEADANAAAKADKAGKPKTAKHLKAKADAKKKKARRCKKKATRPRSKARRWKKKRPRSNAGYGASVKMPPLDEPQITFSPEPAAISHETEEV